MRKSDGHRFIEQALVEQNQKKRAKRVKGGLEISLTIID